ncbi:DUF2188 domain-containing protein [Methanobacterium sp. BAmetb5]|uniref:DUF2188 domain-containing protein n=1 Tax=Methanobacterium sp. BAmetb5 TaxID=2025351 RepID=UPI000E983287|nr:DUF2188 domain-containing protein [Methanobacterium sp. BAmetb5]AXV40386.1 MAG: hypothetical protein CIT02_08670 [Methanobacterium sp. BAmetb5]
MTKKTVHVIPNKKGGWDIKREGGERASVHTDTKSEAENRARELAKKDKTELIIHDKKGKFQKRDSYGNDPYPPKG